MTVEVADRTFGVEEIPDTYSVVWNDSSGILTVQGTPTRCGHPDCDKQPTWHSYKQMVGSSTAQWLRLLPHSFSVYACDQHAYILPSWVRSLLADEQARYDVEKARYAEVGTVVAGIILQSKP